MSGIEAKTFEDPDETVTFDHGHADVVTVGSLPIGREVLEPGWHWSTHVKPIAGTEWCEFHHVSFLFAGRIRIETRDGESRELAAGAVLDLAPGQDAWVVGDEPAISIDFQGIAGWAKVSEPGDRFLTTILFTDIVSSPAAAERLGDRASKRLLSTHCACSRASAVNASSTRRGTAPARPGARPVRSEHPASQTDGGTFACQRIAP